MPEPRPAPVRRSRRELHSGKWKDRIILLLIMNALPIIGVGVIWYRVRRGDSTWGEVIPDSVLVNGPYIAASILLLSVAVWALLPALGSLSGRVRDQLAASDERRRHGGTMRTAWEFAATPFRWIFAVVLWILTAFAWFLTFASLAAFALFLIRAVSPQWVDGWLPFTPPDPRDLLSR